MCWHGKKANPLFFLKAKPTIVFFLSIGLLIALPKLNSGRKQDIAAMTTTLLNHAEVLIPFAAWNLALHRFGQIAKADGRTNQVADRSVMQDQIIEDLADKPEVLHTVDEILPRIDAFSGAEELPAAQKLTALLRIVNEKAMHYESSIK